MVFSYSKLHFITALLRPFFTSIIIIRIMEFVNMIISNVIMFVENIIMEILCHYYFVICIVLHSGYKVLYG